MRTSRTRIPDPPCRPALLHRGSPHRWRTRSRPIHSPGTWKPTYRRPWRWSGWHRSGRAGSSQSGRRPNCKRTRPSHSADPRHKRPGRRRRSCRLARSCRPDQARRCCTSRRPRRSWPARASHTTHWRSSRRHRRSSHTRRPRWSSAAPWRTHSRCHSYSSRPDCSRRRAGSHRPRRRSRSLHRPKVPGCGRWYPNSNRGRSCCSRCKRRRCRSDRSDTSRTRPRRCRIPWESPPSDRCRSCSSRWDRRSSRSCTPLPGSAAQECRPSLSHSCTRRPPSNRR